MNSIVFFLMLATFGIAEELKKFDSITTTAGRTYTKVSVTKIEPDGIRISHESGSAKILYEKLPPEISNQLGKFDSKAAKNFRQQEKNQQAKEEADARKLEEDSARFFLGRLGEISAVFEKRFGQKINAQKGFNLTRLSVIVIASFENGVADYISYTKEPKDIGFGIYERRDFTNDEWKMLFDANKSGGPWEEVDSLSKMKLDLIDQESWVSGDDTRIATYLREHKILMFQTRRHIKKTSDAAPASTEYESSAHRNTTLHPKGFPILNK